MEHSFEDNEKAEKQPKTYQRKKEDHEFDLLIDIQKKLAQGKGKYYVRFAKNFNTKQVAKAVLYLKQHDICKCQYMNVQKVENKNVHFIR